MRLNRILLQQPCHRVCLISTVFMDSPHDSSSLDIFSFLSSEELVLNFGFLNEGVEHVQN